MAFLTGTHIPCFGQKYEKYQIFFIGKFSFFFFFFFFSIYLNSYVFVMLVKFVVGRINGILNDVEIETRKFHY